MNLRPISNSQLRLKITELVETACGEWEQLRDNGIHDSVKLYYLPPSKRQHVGRLKVSSRDPKRGWKAASNMCFSRTWTREEVEFFVHDRLIRVPVLRGPFADIKNDTPAAPSFGATVPVGP